MNGGAPADEWGEIVFALAERFGLGPWEFGELTWPQLACLLAKGKPGAGAGAGAAATRWHARRARALALAAAAKG